LTDYYQEEARHRGESWSDQEIVESILENNLHGLDIDPRAVQIAAAALILKARQLCPKANPQHLNLVASNLQLAALPADDPALVELRHEVTEATGIPETLTNRVVQALQGADYLGSLLKVDTEVDAAIHEYEQASFPHIQGDIFKGFDKERQSLSFEQAKISVLEKLEQFLARRTSGDDLGLRLRGEQLASAIRFIRMSRENSYDLVIGNPPYQGTSKIVDATYLAKHYPRGKADLYAAFLERGLQLARTGGISALLTMRNWMFIQQFSQLRKYLLENFDLRVLGDVDRGAFEEVPDEVVATVISVFQKMLPGEVIAVAIQPTPLDDSSRDSGRTKRKRSAVLAQVGRFEFWSNGFEAIKEKPLVYWWNDAFLKRYTETLKLGDETDVRVGMQTGNNTRFLRQPWEIQLAELLICSHNNSLFGLPHNKWVPHIKDAEGRIWFEPLSDIVLWKLNALEIKLFERDGKQASPPQNERFYFQSGVAFTKIGSSFSARGNRYLSVFDVAGSSVFPVNIKNVCCLMNSAIARHVLNALNPTVNYQVGDVKRLPLFAIESADEIFAKLDEAFTEHEAARETSVEHPDLVKKLIEAEEKRRERKRKKEDQDDYGPLFEEEALHNVTM